MQESGEEESFFFFVVPLKTSHIGNIAGPVTQKLNVRRVLLVDDNRVSLLVAKKMLQRLDVQCDAVSSASVVKERLETGMHDLMLLDFQLDTCSGLELLLDLREQGVALPRLGVIMCSGYVERDIVGQCMAAGCVGYEWCL